MGELPSKANPYICFAKWGTWVNTVWTETFTVFTDRGIHEKYNPWKSALSSFLVELKWPAVHGFSAQYRYPSEHLCSTDYFSSSWALSSSILRFICAVLPFQTISICFTTTRSTLHYFDKNSAQDSLADCQSFDFPSLEDVLFEADIISADFFTVVSAVIFYWIKLCRMYELSGKFSSKLTTAKVLTVKILILLQLWKFSTAKVSVHMVVKI